MSISRPRLYWLVVLALLSGRVEVGHAGFSNEITFSESPEQYSLNVISAGVVGSPKAMTTAWPWENEGCAQSYTSNTFSCAPVQTRSTYWQVKDLNVYENEVYSTTFTDYARVGVKMRHLGGSKSADFSMDITAGDYSNRFRAVVFADDKVVPHFGGMVNDVYWAVLSADIVEGSFLANIGPYLFESRGFHDAQLLKRSVAITKIGIEFEGTIPRIVVTDPGDFTVNAGGPHAWIDGRDDAWSWRFHIGDLGSGAEIVSARLLLDVWPGSSDRDNDTLTVGSLAPISTQRIQRLAVNTENQAFLDLIDYYSSDELMGVINGNGGTLPMTYFDDAIIANASIAVVYRTDAPEPGSLALVGLGLAGLGAICARRSACSERSNAESNSVNSGRTNTARSTRVGPTRSTRVGPTQASDSKRVARLAHPHCGAWKLLSRPKSGALRG